MTRLALPDIAAQTTHLHQPLQWVGMQGIALPAQIDGQRLNVLADAGVSLDDGSARGIHMSRLYLALERLETQELTTGLLREVLNHFIESHEGLSSCAYLRLQFDPLLKPPALISPEAGWKRYPTVLDAKLENGVFHVEHQVEVLYSSTCPCSAALARQLIQERFIKDFANQTLDAQAILQWLGSSAGIVATPHSQRSMALVKVRLDDQQTRFAFEPLIQEIEQALGTAVQTAVKRADEQAFALANGQNLMFCEDAARRLHGSLGRLQGITGFSLRVEHAESLHAHDAVAASQWNW